MTQYSSKLPISKPLLKYLVVGIAAFSVEYGSFYFMYADLNIKPLYIANSVSFGLGLLTSFLLNRAWTFGEGEYSKRASHQLGFYIILALVNLMLTNFIVEFLSFDGINPKIGKLIAMIVTSLWNYILFKLIIFTYKKDTEINSPGS